jgi:hypothetical protein
MKKVEKLNNNEIFVFGSNLKGIHGAGAALKAREFGAVIGVGHGLSGQTYALPTKDYNLKSLSLQNISKYVEIFRLFALYNNHLTFLVTEVGCGLAGYTPVQVAPLFAECLQIPNIVLPESFIIILDNKKDENYVHRNLE